MSVMVVDSLMGTGKTSWALQFMNQNTGHPYMYVTPFLAEVDRVVCGTETGAKLQAPPGDGNKTASLKLMLCAGENIACTHQLFKRLDETSLEIIQKKEYVLILDEVLDAVTVYQGVARDDLLLLQEARFLFIGDAGRIIWNEKVQDSITRFDDLKYFAMNKLAFSTDGSNVVTVFNPNIFKVFSEVYVLTYLFEGSIMKPYFQLAQIDYQIYNICKNAGVYNLSEGICDASGNIPEIVICSEKFAYRKEYMKKTAFSIGWLGRLKAEQAKVVKNDLHNYFQNKLHAQVETILYTTSKEGRVKLDGKGYKTAFLAWNARASNDYSDRFNLAYCFNCFVNPALKNYFHSYSIGIDEEAYATANLLQWVWRSRIRNGEPINIFIPSVRMRELLFNWIQLHKARKVQIVS